MKLEIIKKHPDAIMPTKAHPSDVGFDLTAISLHKKINQDILMFDTGLSVIPPPGYYTEIVSRSSITKTGWMLANGVGIIDPNYTGNLYIVLIRVVDNSPEPELPFCKCQLIVRKNEKVTLVEKMKDSRITDRGDGGFGSTDKVSTSVNSSEFNWVHG